MRETYVLMPLFACLVNALCAVVIYTRDPGHRGNQVATALLAGAAWWGFCQVLWTVSRTAEIAYFWHHLATPGWCFIGPLSLHLILATAKRPRPTAARLLPASYVAGALFTLLGLGTAWLQADARPAPWGWTFEPGPGHVWYLALTFGCVVPAVWIALRELRAAVSPAERRQLRIVGFGIAVPFVLGGLSAGFLPLLGVQLPRLGSASFAVLAIAIAWSYHRYGFSALTAGSFSREILETLPTGLALVSLEGAVLSANEQMARLLQISPDELVGYPIGRALSDDVPGQPADELRDHECHLETARDERRPVSISTSLLLDKLGLPIGRVLVVQDLREVVELRNHLVTSGRLAAMGELAAGIAHEINNPIAFVRANLSQLQGDWRELSERLSARAPEGPDGEPDAKRQSELISEGEELLAECIEGVDRTVRIVQDVTGFVRGGSGERRLVDLRASLASALRVAKPQLRLRAQVEEELSEVPPVLASASELQQVFLNLIVNASQAIDGNGRVRVATSADSEWVEVRIQDDGCGIPAEDLERIFDPFFTTKPVGEGTGLGLAISYQILRRHEAQVHVESELGRGTTFTIRFPRAESGEA